MPMRCEDRSPPRTTWIDGWLSSTTFGFFSGQTQVLYPHHQGVVGILLANNDINGFAQERIQLSADVDTYQDIGEGCRK